MSDALLEIEKLTVSFPAPREGRVDVVRSISFSVGRERLGIVGESRLGEVHDRASHSPAHPATGPDRCGPHGLPGKPLLTRSEREMREVRGAGISMVMQDPKFSLNPVMTIGDQIAEALDTHERLSSKETRRRVVEMLHAVRIDDPERVSCALSASGFRRHGPARHDRDDAHPKPDLLIADEPTSALDVSVQAQVLDIVHGLVRDNGMGLIFISHDLNLVAGYCDRILVMYRGEIVEECAAGRLNEARHPYTRGLLAAVPRLDETRETLPVMDRRLIGGT